MAIRYDADAIIQVLEDVLQTLRRPQRKRTRTPVTVAELDSRGSGGKRRPVTESQLRGLLLHRTVQRDKIEHAIKGIRAKLQAMGVDPAEIECRTWPSRSCELKLEAPRSKCRISQPT